MIAYAVAFIFVQSYVNIVIFLDPNNWDILFLSGFFFSVRQEGTDYVISTTKFFAL